MLVVVLILENPDRFAIRLTEQISSIGLFAVTESQLSQELKEGTERIWNPAIRMMNLGSDIPDLERRIERI